MKFMRIREVIEIKIFEDEMLRVFLIGAVISFANIFNEKVAAVLVAITLLYFLVTYR